MKITAKHFDDNPSLTPKEIIDKVESKRYLSKLPLQHRKNRAERLDELTIKKNEDK